LARDYKHKHESSSVAQPPSKTVRLELRGENAQQGIELDSLERFIDKFRDALRDFERSASAREHLIGRGGHPDARSMAATRFRLVGYKIGSAILDLADPIIESETDALDTDAEGPATQNLRSLLDSLDAGDLDSVVVDALDEARRTLGEHGRFDVKVAKRHQVTHIDTNSISRLRARCLTSPSPQPVTVFGRLHLIASEGNRVEIRATDHYNWKCSYDPKLEEKVIPLITKRVWATGLGTRERANRGALTLEDIGALPEYEMTSLFTDEVVSTEDLQAEQGVDGPQGIAALGVPDIPQDELDRFLAIVLE
jgi:hypothetical protein